jgi:hypothetical protein
VFWFLSFVPEPLSLAAQSLIARDRTRPALAASWALLLLCAGSTLGVALAGVVALVFHNGTWVFVSDAGVQRAVQQLAPTGVLAMVRPPPQPPRSAQHAAPAWSLFSRRARAGEPAWETGLHAVRGCVRGCPRSPRAPLACPAADLLRDDDV